LTIKYNMRRKKSKISFAICLLFGFIGCTEYNTPSEVEKQKLLLSDCFKNALRIDLNDHDLAVFSPSKLSIKGVFEGQEAHFVLYSYGLQECILYNSHRNEVERIFAIPRHEGWGEPHLLEVLSLDSILYFDFEHQSMVVCNTEKVVFTSNLLFDEDYHLPYQNIQHLHKFLRSIDGYVGFNTWIAYGEGGFDVDYDGLMDERNMVSFFKFHGDLTDRRDIPVKPILRRTTFTDVMYVDQPFFEVNSKQREVLIFHVSSDTVMTYGWDSGQIKKHVIIGSEVELFPAKVPRRGSAADVLAMYESQERGHHRIYFDHQSGMYLRELVKMFPVQGAHGLPPRPDIRLLQVLNSDFEVIAEMDLPEDYKLSKRVGKSIFLQKSDDEKRELVLYKFHWVEPLS